MKREVDFYIVLISYRVMKYSVLKKKPIVDSLKSLRLVR